MATLARLPVEIHDDILRRLSTEDLSSLRLTCRAAVNAVDPVFHRGIKWNMALNDHGYHDAHGFDGYDDDWNVGFDVFLEDGFLEFDQYAKDEQDDDDDEDSEGGGDEGCEEEQESKYQTGLETPHPIHTFFQAMHQRPGLRRYVKTVALLSHDRIQCWSHRLPPIPAPPAIRALWMHALQHLGLPRATAVVSAAEIEEGNPGVFVALLLASLLDVRVLWLDYHLLRESDLLVGLFRGEQYFPCLERLEIWNNVDDGIVHYHPALQLSPVLSLSRLIFLQVILQREQNVAPPTLPELVELDIINHLSSPQVIATILANTPKLEKLTYFLVEDIHHLCLGGPSTAHHDEWRLFSEALTPVSKTLRILKISIDHVSPVSYSPYDWDNRWMIDLLWVFMIDHRRGPIGSLKSLRHLTKLEIPAYLLVGRHSQRLQNILPPQIEKLYLRDDYVLEGPLRNRDDDVRKMLGQYLLEKNRTIPLSLKHLRFVLRGSEYGTDHEWTDSTVNKVFGGEGRLLRLQRLARRAGIKCSLIGGKGDGSRAFWSPGLVMDEVFEVVVYDPEIEDWGVGDKYTHGWNGHLQFLRDSEREKLSRTFYNRSPRQWAYSGSVLRELFQINPLVI